jgi:hypothetical protein
MRPGISTRPFAAMTPTSAFLSTVIGLTDIRSIVLPLTSKLDGAESAAFLPLNMRGHSETASLRRQPK